MIMTNYAGFIKDDHLKIDTSFELFETRNGQNLVTMLQSFNKTRIM